MDKVFSFFASIVLMGVLLGVLVLGISLGYKSESSVPFRKGDLVMVRSGFHAGQTGECTERHVYNAGVRILVDLDGDGVGGTQFRPSEIMLIGDWNRTEIDGT